jgi:hypothetical protein
MTQKCLDVMHQYGEYPDGNDIQSLLVPSPVVDICAGDFLVSDTVASELVAKKLSAFAWDTNLATTRIAAKAAFKGVALGEVDSGSCNSEEQVELPVARYAAGSKFTRSYKIVDADGAETTAQWVRGQGFTFAKAAGSNALQNDAVVKTDTANITVFKAVKDSGPAQSRVEVEFSA